MAHSSISAAIGPHEFPGLKEVHAVDASGVHPLLLAIGHERYMPFVIRYPRNY
jgi:4-hydroxy-3-polyprenylbenzoate decarboxylase